MTIETANFIVTAILTAVGLVLGYSYQRQIALRVAERRITAYAAMWSKMAVATPVRTAKWQKTPQPLTPEERKQLFYELTMWYFQDGNGLLLGGRTRAMYLKTKENLVCPVDYYEPEFTRKKLQDMSPERQDYERGRLAIKQLSQLRTRMKADLAVYGPPYHDDSLDEDDKSFLKACGEKTWRKPWANP